MAGGRTGRFGSFRVSDPGSIEGLVVLSVAAEAQKRTGSAAGCGSGHRAHTGRETGYLWISAHSCAAHPGGHPDQFQDGVAYPSPERLAFLHAQPFTERKTAARGAGERAGTEPPMGFRHYEHKGLERGEGASGSYHRLCRPDGAGLAVRPADAFGRVAGDGSGSGLSTIRERKTGGPKPRVFVGQRAGIRLPETPKTSCRLRDGSMPDPPQKPRIQRAGGGFLRQLQAGLRLSERTAEPECGRPANTRMDKRLQPTRPAQRLGDESPRGILCGLDGKNKPHTCADLSGSVQSIICSNALPNRIGIPVCLAGHRKQHQRKN